MKKPALVAAATHALTHPLSSVAYVAGIVRGTAATIIRVATGQDEESTPGVVDDVRKAAPAAPAAPARPAAVPTSPAAVTEAAPQRAPGPVGESFATEPSAVTRTSAHGGHGDDALIDDWEGDAEENPAASSVVEALEMGDGVGNQVDHGAMSAALSESETLRKGAER